MMQITVRETTTKVVWVIHHSALEPGQAVCIHADGVQINILVVYHPLL